MPVDHHGRIRLLLRHHVIKRTVYRSKLRRAKFGLPPLRRKAGSDQKPILLPQRHVECVCDLPDHVAARLRAAKLKKA